VVSPSLQSHSFLCIEIKTTEYYCSEDRSSPSVAVKCMLETNNKTKKILEQQGHEQKLSLTTVSAEFFSQELFKTKQVLFPALFLVEKRISGDLSKS
jgi:hypothetical protein